MGFSPGDFAALVDTHDFGRALVSLHFERKSGDRIVLWSHNELQVYFEVDLANAELMVSQLRVLLDVDV